MRTGPKGLIGLGLPAALRPHAPDKGGSFYAGWGLAFDFVRGLYRVGVGNGASTSWLTQPGVSYARSGVAYQQNASGTWVPFDENVPPISDGVGLGVWEARTNSIRNPTGLGAVAGTPGTLPTNWLVQYNPSGVTVNVAGTGIENGLPYVDFSCSGTWGAVSQFNLGFDGATAITAANGDTWTQSANVRATAGNFSGVSALTLCLVQNGSGGAYITETNSSDLKGSITGPTLCPASLQSTLSGGGTVARIQPQIKVTGTTGQSFAFTIRIAAPNLKLGANINDPPILQTNNAAATRGAASAYLNAPGLIVPSLGVTVVVDVTWPRTLTTTGIFVEPYNAGGGTPAGFTIGSNVDGTRPRLLVRQGSGRADTAGTAPVVTPGARVKMAVSFDATTGLMSQGGATLTSGATPSQSDYAGEPIYVGSRLGSQFFANGAINSVSFLQGLRTQAELNALTV